MAFFISHRSFSFDNFALIKKTPPNRIFTPLGGCALFKPLFSYNLHISDLLRASLQVFAHTNRINSVNPAKIEEVQAFTLRLHPVLHRQPAARIAFIASSGYLNVSDSRTSILAATPSLNMTLIAPVSVLYVWRTNGVFFFDDIDVHSPFSVAAGSPSSAVTSASVLPAMTGTLNFGSGGASVGGLVGGAGAGGLSSGLTIVFSVETTSLNSGFGSLLHPVSTAKAASMYHARFMANLHLYSFPYDTMRARMIGSQ